MDDKQVADTSSRADAHDSTARRVLIVDDNSDAADTTQLLLEIRGHLVTTAYDGRSALDVARTSCPDVVLLDLTLPDLDGYEVATRLREVPTARQAQLIAITGWSDPQMRARAREHGFVAHLTKPFDVEELLELIDAAPRLEDGLAPA